MKLSSMLLAVFGFAALNFILLLMIAYIDDIFYGGVPFPIMLAAVLLLFASTFCAIWTIVSWIICRVRGSHPLPAPEAGASESSRPRTLPKTRTKTFPEYQVRLDQLAEMKNDIQQRQASLSGFLKEYFNNSVISVSRYESVMLDAGDVLSTNLEKAEQAVDMFGGSMKPNPERLAILDAYVNDSKAIVIKMEGIVDELIKVQQSRVIHDSDHLDEMLDSLSETTSRYS